MNFEFSDDEQQLREAVQRWVERGYGFERRTAIAKAGGFSAEAWGEIAELGLLGLGTSEDDGGMAMGPVAAMLALEALGRGLVLEPVAAVALVAASVARAGARRTCARAGRRASPRARRAWCWPTRNAPRATGSNASTPGPSRPATRGRSAAPRASCRSATRPTRSSSAPA